jgi:membrane protease YdiL (CAAX protease family)
MISPKPWRTESVLLCAALLLFFVSFGAIVGQLLPYLLPSQVLDFYKFLFGTFIVQGAAIALIGFFLSRHQMRWRDVLLPYSSDFGFALALGLVAGLAVLPFAFGLNKLSYNIMILLDLQPEKQAAVAIVEKTVEPWKHALFGVTAIGVAPFVEEFLFRGILYPFLKQRIQPLLAVTITSVIFATIHFNVLTFLPLVFFAFVLTAVYEKTDALLAPILAHAFFNAVNFFMLIYQDELVRYLKRFT